MEQIIQEILSHIAVLNDEMGGIQGAVKNVEINLATVTANVAWLMRFFWLLAGVAVANLFATVYHHKKNNKK